MRKLQFIGLTVLLVFGFTLFGCPPTKDPLGVVMTAPANDETGVTLGSSGTTPTWVQFETLIDRSSVKTDTMTIVDQNNVKVNGITTWAPHSGSETSIMFNYTNGGQLKPGTKYTVKVRKDITSSDNTKAMLSDYSFSFTTDGLLVTETYPIAQSTGNTFDRGISVTFDNLIDVSMVKTDTITVQEKDSGLALQGITFPTNAHEPYTDQIIFILLPNERAKIKPNTVYKVTVKAGQRSMDTTLVMGTDYIFYFTTAQ